MVETRADGVCEDLDQLVVTAKIVFFLEPFGASAKAELDEMISSRSLR